MSQAREPKPNEPAQPEEVVTLSTNCSGVNGYLRNIAVCYGADAPNLACVSDFRQTIEHVVANHPGRAGLFLVIEPSSTPAPEVREALGPVFRDVFSKLRAGVFVVKAHGFAGAVQRSILSGALIALRKGAMLRVFASVDDASIWLSEQLQLGADAADRSARASALSASVQGFCSRHDISMGVPAS